MNSIAIRKNKRITARFNTNLFLLIIGATLSLTLVTFGLSRQSDARVQDWNAGYIISDFVFTNTSTMSASSVQSFLNGKVTSCDTWGTQTSEFGGGTRRQWAESKGYSAPFTCLKDYSENGKSAAQIIYDTAQKYQINPQVLLVLLQKEQSLVTDTWPLSIQYRSATGYGCPDTAPCDSQYYGLTNQLDWSAKMFRAIMNASSTWYTPYIVGNNYIRYSPDSSCGGSTVNIQNRATQALYNYTPYQPNEGALNADWGSAPCGAYGNRNFYLYFTSWFGNTTSYPAANGVDVTSGTYVIRGVNSGKALDVQYGQSVSGAPVQIYQPNGTGAQTWNISRLSSGYYSIKNAQSGKVLDVPGAYSGSGTQLQIWDSNGTCAQKWVIEKSTGNSYSFINECAGLALAVRNNATDDSASVQTSAKGSDSSQSWLLLPASNNPVEDGLYSLETSANYSVDIPGGSTASGTKVQMYSNNNSNAQIWQFIKQDSGLYKVRNPQSGKYLAAQDGNSLATSIQISDTDASSCAQQWSIRNDGGYYTLSSACSGLVLDVSGGAISTNGAALQLWSSNDSNAQRWKLDRYSGVPNGELKLFTMSNYSIDIPGGSTASGTALQLFSNNNSNAQIWQFIKQDSGLYKVRNPQSGKYLAIQDTGKTAGAKIQIADEDTSCTQQWSIRNDGGYYTLSSACSGLVLDVSGGAISTNGAALQAWTSNGSSAQKWKLGY